MKIEDAIIVLKESVTILSRANGKTILKDAIDIAIEALEKQIAKKPRENSRKVIAGIDGANCGLCGGLIFNPSKYCNRCGQKLIWGNEE